MQLDIFFTYYLKTHRIVLAQNGRKKKSTSSHGSDDDDGKWKIFPIFFWLEMTARWCYPPWNKRYSSLWTFASGRHYLRIYGSGAGFVGPTWSPDLTGSSQGCDVNLSWQNVLTISSNELKRRPAIFELKAWYFDMSEVIKFLLVGGS